MPMNITILAAGTLLSFASAVLPHYDGAYRLEPLILTAGLLLYLIYGVLSQFLTPHLANMSGLAVFTLHLLIAVHQRWLTDGHLSGTLLYWFPLLLALGLLGLIPRASYANRAEGDSDPDR
jgi:hypothetical protein